MLPIKLHDIEQTQVDIVYTVYIHYLVTTPYETKQTNLPIIDFPNYQDSQNVAYAKLNSTL